VCHKHSKEFAPRDYLEIRVDSFGETSTVFCQIPRKTNHHFDDRFPHHRRSNQENPHKGEKESNIYSI
jgi:hypothetical protein